MIDNRTAVTVPDCNKKGLLSNFELIRYLLTCVEQLPILCLQLLKGHHIEPQSLDSRVTEDYYRHYHKALVCHRNVVDFIYMYMFIYV